MPFAVPGKAPWYLREASAGAEAGDTLGIRIRDKTTDRVLFVIAACAHWTGPTPEDHRLGARDVAGALVLLGFAAALLSDAELALAALDEWRAALVAAAPM